MVPRSRFSCAASLLRHGGTRATIPLRVWPSTSAVQKINGETRTFSSGSGSEVHGGDDIYKVAKLVCDFSVTTNALGPVPSALKATRRLLEGPAEVSIAGRGGDTSAILVELDDIGVSEVILESPAVEHYPRRHDVELERLTACFLRGTSERVEEAEQRLLFGNGASELIDLICRLAPEGQYCINPHVQVQYREYQRACKNAGRTAVEDPSKASVICLVNPNNPTGDFLERGDMESWIEKNASPGSWVVVDESMLFWAGSNWHTRGVSAEFVQRMADRFINVFLVTSWTKIFSCTGIRIGSVMCPSVAKKTQLEAKMVPWSVTMFAREYLKAALQERSYLERTWHSTPLWRSHIVSRLQNVHPEWTFHGMPWLSWVWVDTHDPAVAEDVYRVALECGCPVRHAKSGYDRPSVVRLAVRRPYDFSVLYQALLSRKCKKLDAMSHFGSLVDVHPSVVEGVKLIHIDDLKAHEQTSADLSEGLVKYAKNLPQIVLPAIIVESKYNIVIDGHHRLSLFRSAGMSIVPVVVVNYAHEDILVNPPNSPVQTSKEGVVSTAVSGKFLPPKSTRHMVRTRSGALMPIAVLAPQIAELMVDTCK